MLKDIKAFIYYQIWEISQAYALLFGKRTEVFYEGKKGFYVTNHFNNTDWFVPYDKSYWYKTYYRER